MFKFFFKCTGGKWFVRHSPKILSHEKKSTTSSSFISIVQYVNILVLVSNNKTKYILWLAVLISKQMYTLSDFIGEEWLPVLSSGTLLPSANRWKPSQRKRSAWLVCSQMRRSTLQPSMRRWFMHGTLWWRKPHTGRRNSPKRNSSRCTSMTTGNSRE